MTVKTFVSRKKREPLRRDAHCHPRDGAFRWHNVSRDNVDLGEVDSASYDSVTDNSKNWGINCWVPGVIRYEDSGYSEIRRIKNNSDKTITVEDIWLVTPFQGTVFEVIDTSTWQLCTDVPGDNVNCDGTTNISWNLE